LEKGNRLLASRSLTLLTTDHDGNAIVDHLGEHIRNILQKSPGTSTDVSGAYNFVSAEYERHKLERVEAEKVGNVEALSRQKLLAGRYELLKKYYEKHLPSWGIE